MAQLKTCSSVRRGLAVKWLANPGARASRRKILIAAVAIVATTLPGEGAGVGSACGGPRGVRCDPDLFCETEPSSCGPGNSTCSRKPQTCTADYNPVCGCNNRTYSNDCERQRSGVSKKHDGACQPRQQ